jgi:hypothetical protein
MPREDGGYLAPGFSYFYVHETVAPIVRGQRKESSICHVQVVKERQRPLDTAGAAGSWLGRNGIENITQLFIVGHGGPGRVIVGQELTSKTIVPLGGWLGSFLDPTCKIRILGCSSAADSELRHGRFLVGQMSQSNDRPGYDLLYGLARATNRIVEGALNGQSNTPLGLKGGCRRVYPDGRQERFLGGGIKDPWD